MSMKGSGRSAGSSIFSQRKLASLSISGSAPGGGLFKGAEEVGGITGGGGWLLLPRLPREDRRGMPTWGGLLHEVDACICRIINKVMYNMNNVVYPPTR